MKPSAVLIVLVVTAVSLAACATWDPQVRALTRDPYLKGWTERCQAGDQIACDNVRERVNHPFAACPAQPDGRIACN